ncbi:MAG: hemolysin family protein [Bryobacteraceae bacterium]
MSYRLFLLIGILAVNGFFAASEVALVSVRRSRLRALAARGQLGAQAALNLLANPARLLSVTQVGVTLASLALGWAGEDTLFALLYRFVAPWVTPDRAAILHGVCFALAFLLMSYAHVVIGEVVPKNLAIEKADRLAILVAPVLLVFYRISEPFVFVIERSAAFLSRLLGLRGTHHGGVHSPEELKLIVNLSRTEGHLRQFEEDAIRGLLELQDYSAREIMVPRNAIISVAADADLDNVLRVMTGQKFSRLLVYETSLEKIIGFVHYKDLLRVWQERRLANENRRPTRPFRLRSLVRKPLVLPETKPLSDLIDEFRESHTHMALIVDEFGTIAGLITLEDVLEQVFGEISDEHDLKRTLPEIEAPTLELDGTTLIRDLDNQYGIELPGDAGFETLAGFLLFRLGYIPHEGESVEYGGRRYTILTMDRNRIASVRIERMTAEQTSGEQTAT